MCNCSDHIVSACAGRRCAGRNDLGTVNATYTVYKLLKFDGAAAGELEQFVYCYICWQIRTFSKIVNRYILPLFMYQEE